MSMKKFRYIGEYGKRQRGGFVPHIGIVFYQDEVFYDEEHKLIRFARPATDPVPATAEALSVLHGEDFSSEVTCEHRHATGDGCRKPPVEGSRFCQFHDRLARKRVVNPEPVAEPELPQTDSVEKN